MMMRSFLTWQCLLLVVLGMAYAFLLPPFEAPDETGHMARAHGVAEGQFYLKDHPRYLYLYGAQLEAGQNPDSVVDMNVYLSQFSGERIPTFAPNTALYSPLPYVLHGILFRLGGTGKQVSFEVFRLSFYLVRLLTLLVFVSFYYFAACQLNWMSWPLFWLAATPMVLSLAGAIHIDPLILGATYVLLAVSLSSVPVYIYALGVVGAGVLLMMTKPSYAPLLLIPLIGLVGNDVQTRKSRAIWLLFALFFAVIGGVMWNRAALDIYYEPGGSHEFHSRLVEWAEIDPQKQLAAMLANPAGFAKVLGRTLVVDNDLFVEFIGVLGRLNVPLPEWAIYLWAVIALLAVADTQVPNAISRDLRLFYAAAFITAAGLTFVAVALSLYMAYSPLNFPIILYGQGRHYHVAGLVFLVGLTWLNPIRLSEKATFRLSWFLITAAAAINLVGLVSIAKKFY